MRLCCLAVLAALIAPPALAQTGPLAARIVVAAMPDPGHTNIAVEPSRIIVKMSVDVEGRPTDVQLSSSSGDPKYDERVRRLYLKMRVIPALTGSGEPIASNVQFALTVQGLGFAQNPELWSAQTMGYTVSNPGLNEERLTEEVERIVRMRCKDFLWEYDLMKKIAGKRPLYDERLFRSLLAMTLVQTGASGDQVDRLIRGFPQSVRTSVDQCRESPDIAFFKGAFIPAIEAKLR
jgi:TonB family protein